MAPGLCAQDKMSDDYYNTIRFIDAAKKGEDDVIEEYINDKEYNVTVNAVDAQGNTALHAASQTGELSSVQLLLRYGANVNATDKSGETPLHKAAWRGHAEVCKILVTAGADRTKRNRDGKTPAEVTATPHVKSVVLAPVAAAVSDDYGEKEDDDTD
eukprot:TRINITY_DN952_c0_g1_i1.p1 TRINITY_DN952_c0_g1~~TRINITY_DN952_c0_g1_i1.p1  ORF type:complete len:157 (-),score=42.09 TRINITY_DN952_c0_g1_i1:70-540(-)